LRPVKVICRNDQIHFVMKKGAPHAERLFLAHEVFSPLQTGAAIPY